MDFRYYKLFVIFVFLQANIMCNFDDQQKLPDQSFFPSEEEIVNRRPANSYHHTGSVSQDLLNAHISGNGTGISNVVGKAFGGNAAARDRDPISKVSNGAGDIIKLKLANPRITIDITPDISPLSGVIADTSNCNFLLDGKIALIERDSAASNKIELVHIISVDGSHYSYQPMTPICPIDPNYRVEAYELCDKSVTVLELNTATRQVKKIYRFKAPMNGVSGSATEEITPSSTVSYGSGNQLFAIAESIMEPYSVLVELSSSRSIVRIWKVKVADGTVLGPIMSLTPGIAVGSSNRLGGSLVTDIPLVCYLKEKDTAGMTVNEYFIDAIGNVT